jgi:hypothetical protein
MRRPALQHKETKRNSPAALCTLPAPCSPEIANGWASYDEKVDLYSLGVVAFELWHPFATGMERVVLLRDLRENDVMPADFEAANPVVREDAGGLASSEKALGASSPF